MWVISLAAQDRDSGFEIDCTRQKSTNETAVSAITLETEELPGWHLISSNNITGKKTSL